MRNLKKNLGYTLCILLAYALVSCGSEVKYPQYSLEKIEYIPDSLKIEHREWIKETIRAASQHMTGGDYEDVDVTIRQTKATADELFQVSVVGLNKQINDRYWDDVEIKPIDMNDTETTIFLRLLSGR